MGALLDGLPLAIEIDGKEYQINSDFHTGLRIILAFEDTELTISEKSFILVDQLYQEEPEDFVKAVSAGIRYLDCGEEQREGGGNGCRMYSFSQDERHIFSGVDKVLNGRLSRGEYVHWWEFVFAFMELPEDCMMSKILYFRSRRNAGKLTKEEREVWTKNRELFELEEPQTAKEKEQFEEFMGRLGKNG